MFGARNDLYPALKGQPDVRHGSLVKMRDHMQ